MMLVTTPTSARKKSLSFYALVGVVTNKYQYLTMKYNAVSQIPASKTIHNVGDNTNIGENQSHPLLDRLVNHILDPWPDVQAG